MSLNSDNDYKFAKARTLFVASFSLSLLAFIALLFLGVEIDKLGGMISLALLFTLWRFLTIPCSECGKHFFKKGQKISFILICRHCGYKPKNIPFTQD